MSAAVSSGTGTSTPGVEAPADEEEGGGGGGRRTGAEMAARCLVEEEEGAEEGAEASTPMEGTEASTPMAQPPMEAASAAEARALVQGG